MQLKTLFLDLDFYILFYFFQIQHFFHEKVKKMRCFIVPAAANTASAANLPEGDDGECGCIHIHRHLRQA